ncbi:Ppx/GppA family phosphatase [Telmatospirillum siberiense]|uniref:Exopolyphosphatase n=1 Tax=Telmatospirillum siberiense TaxID=382514 RepID=A0A2N3PU95_9PROT|nr:Ppx/GppA family phosphatase [Telmatospirillum siberiense]PKU23968.1 exopolyphosphatase [Telmatospirillum siberiense]
MVATIVPAGNAAHRHLAIIDIGSNSIRLVVYDGRIRTPVALFNEKAVCALGQGLGQSGRLNPQGAEEAIGVLARFVRLARAMAVDVLDILATAAVRDALDGAEFVAAVERRCGAPVTVLTGEEEAHLAAMGVLCSAPQADGMVADLGGGSLELVALDHGRFAGPHATMPLGVLRLSEASGNVRSRAEDLIEKQFRNIDWWQWAKDRPLYAVGGAWRALARLCLAQTGHPLHVLDNYSLERNESLRLIELISNQSRKSLEKIPGLSKKRVPHLPVAALLLEKVIEYARPSRLIFSVYGMREGQFYKRLPPDVQWQDPLIASCSDMAQTAGRFPEHGEEMLEWMAALFRNETESQGRLRYAACLLGDVFWNEHPDYRAEQAFLRVFRLPFMGLGHQDRAALALAIHARYEGDGDLPEAADARNLLSEEEQRRARIIGLALRLGHSISGGVPGLLRTTRLFGDGDVLVLEVPAGDPAFQPDLMDRRYDRLAKTAGFDHFEIRKV